MLRIDGSYGEGGGQVLRTALALSAITGRAVEVVNIRANRPNPGLATQHLHGVKALARLCSARVEGAEVGSTRVYFEPGELKPQRLRIDMGTAGSISLILQVLLLPSAFAGGEVVLDIKGGTDVRWAPPIDYVKHVLLPVVARLGISAELEVLSRGYYPRGGGRVRARVRPAERLTGVDLRNPGRVLQVRGKAHASRLPGHVVEREAEAARRLLSEYSPEIALEVRKDFSTGTGITLWACCENSRLGAGALGERGKPAEQVGEEAARALLTEIKSGAGVDIHLADQLIPFLALAEGKSAFTVRELSGHLRTNIFVTEQILGRCFEVKQEGELFLVCARGAGHA
ncbi:MAG: RNA 3'-terminal phosphate cyclase [Euryarchaeota archaeon]|nr:RNA 3'-terminal phosphate cyclase [Euryarchaeota archaeon]